MKRSAFNKWYLKQSDSLMSDTRGNYYEAGWFAALKWSCMTYNNHPAHLIDKIREEIAKCQNEH